jgi:hypothetical protein
VLKPANGASKSEYAVKKPLAMTAKVKQVLGGPEYGIGVCSKPSSERAHHTRSRGVRRCPSPFPESLGGSHSNRSRGASASRPALPAEGRRHYAWITPDADARGQCNLFPHRIPVLRRSVARVGLEASAFGRGAGWFSGVCGPGLRNTPLIRQDASPVGDVVEVSHHRRGQQYARVDVAARCARC